MCNLVQTLALVLTLSPSLHESSSLDPPWEAKGTRTKELDHHERVRTKLKVPPTEVRQVEFQSGDSLPTAVRGVLAELLTPSKSTHGLTGTAARELSI